MNSPECQPSGNFKRSSWNMLFQEVSMKPSDFSKLSHFCSRTARHIYTFFCLHFSDIFHWTYGQTEKIWPTCVKTFCLNPFILIKHHYLTFHIRLCFFPETHIHNIFTLILYLLSSYLITRSNCFDNFFGIWSTWVAPLPQLWDFVSLSVIKYHPVHNSPPVCQKLLSSFRRSAFKLNNFVTKTENGHFCREKLQKKSKKICWMQFCKGKNFYNYRTVSIFIVLHFTLYKNLYMSFPKRWS